MCSVAARKVRIPVSFAVRNVGLGRGQWLLHDRVKLKVLVRALSSLRAASHCEHVE